MRGCYYFLECVTSKYFLFNARASRSEYWYYVLIVLILNMSFKLLSFVPIVGAYSEIFWLLISLFLLISGFNLTARRLHDTGRSAWWMLIMLVPFIGQFAFLYSMVEGGVLEENKFGSNPKDNGVEKYFFDQTESGEGIR